MIKERLEKLRKHLLDTSFRNPLVHVNRASKRAIALNILDAQADDVFQILRQGGKKMRFAENEVENDKQVDTDEAGDAQEIVLGDQVLPESVRRTEKILQTELNSDTLQKRLLKILRSAKTAEEEQGVNILYLATGFLRWYDSENSNIPRESPLILLPVTLMRDKRSTIHLLSRDDDLVFNLPLQKRLQENFGIDLPMIDEDDDWTPSAYFDEVNEKTKHMSQREIDRNGMRLGFFSFHKFLMWQDLNPENWITSDGENSLTKHFLVNGLLGEGFPTNKGDDDSEEYTPLDKKLAPSDLVQVVDADASQTKVIEAVRNGRNLVVQGPPGTGKSQTITNILAAAAHDGKKVLFIAEKMAALEVVYKRMHAAGLSDICLELHSHRANKKNVLEELRRTLNSPRSSADAPSCNAKNLRQTRDRLNQISDLLHDKIQNRDYSPFNVIADMVELRGRNIQPPTISRDGLHNLPDDEVRRILESIGSYAEAIKRITPKAEHPFRGVQKTNLSPINLERIAKQLENNVAKIGGLLDDFSQMLNRTEMKFGFSIGDMRRAVETLQNLQNAPNSIGNTLSVSIANIDDRVFRDGVSAGASWLRSKNGCAEYFNESAWEYSVKSIRPHIAKGVASWVSRIFGKYRNASKEFATLLQTQMPKTPSARLKLVDDLIDVQKKRKTLAGDENHLNENLGAAWRGERTDFFALHEMIEWLDLIKAKQPNITEAVIVTALQYVVEQKPDIEGFTNAINSVESGGVSLLEELDLRLDDNINLTDANLVELNERFKKMNDNPDRQYGDWCSFLEQRKKIHGHAALRLPGFSQLVKMWDDDALAEDSAEDVFRYAVAEARWDYANAQLPELAGLRPETTDRKELVDEFKQLEMTWMQDVIERIRKQHHKNLPRGDAGEMKFLDGEMAKKTRHKSIRKIMSSAGKVIADKIKPVLLMSPISVAQFLPPNHIEFDLLVIDEASQVRPEDALGAIARTKQLVVVGDQKQLPPTAFFTRLTAFDDDEEDDDRDNDGLGDSPEAAEMESVLTLCDARGMSQRMLEWHYRSRDPSLIEVSNREFYGGSLIIPPSPVLTGEVGLKFTQVPGVYKSPRNLVEAEAVVDAVAMHAQQCPDLSVGIVTFSIRQADLVSDVLESRRRKDPVLNRFLSQSDDANGKPDAFVKNIENVQGDERDTIFISVGYGPVEPNQPLTSMRFGPVNNEGGERRLNVLFTRARVRCEIYASFSPENIDLTRARSKGAKVLKEFLMYAKTGQLTEPHATGAEADSPFEIDVAREIEKHGYIAVPQVQHGKPGHCKFKIDIGVRHPQHHDKYILAVECDGASYHGGLWARERDRQRQEILEDLGWRFHRIWSTDWFYQRDAQIARLVKALDAAKEQSDTPKSPPIGNRATVEPSISGLPPRVKQTVLTPTGLTVAHYQELPINSSSTKKFDEVESGELRKMIVSTVKHEGPVHADEIARRVAAKFNAPYGSRIKRVVREKLNETGRKSRLKNQGDFWFTLEQEAKCPVRDRSKASTSIKAVEHIPEMEICAAAALIESESGEVATDELVLRTAKLLGFSASENLKKKIRLALQQ